MKEATADRPATFEHFARVLPIVGPSLAAKKVAVLGMPNAGALIKCLAANGLRTWLLADPDDGSTAALGEDLSAQHGEALAIDITSVPTEYWLDRLVPWSPDLIIVLDGCGSQARLLSMSEAMCSSWLWIQTPRGEKPCTATVVLSGEPPGPDLPGHVGREDCNTIDDWAWKTSAPLCARLARALLLTGTPASHPDLEAIWARGSRTLLFGDVGDPLAVLDGRRVDFMRDPQERVFRTPRRRNGAYLVVGLGSLGSIAAIHLASYAAKMVIVDPDVVDVYNPVRQSYPLSDIGEAKATALSRQLSDMGVLEVVPAVCALEDESTVAQLLVYHPISAALVTTGTAADFAIARALRARGVAHMVGRCYPRGRFWEAVTVDGRDGPAFEELRGHVRVAPAPPPTPEQITAYSDDGSLEAEPATLIESGWAAAWMARLTAQLGTPPGLRERWFLELIAAEATCLVGGVKVEETSAGPAYGIELPGQIHAWQRADLT